MLEVLFSAASIDNQVDLIIGYLHVANVDQVGLAKRSLWSLPTFAAVTLKMVTPDKGRS